MDWKSTVELVSGNWAVIFDSMPVFLILIVAISYFVFLGTKGYYAREIKNEKGLRALAEKGEMFAKNTIRELENKLSAKSSASPNIAVNVIMQYSEVKEAFQELNSTQGLHLPIDPRASLIKFAKFVETQEQIQRLAAARYLLERGWMGDIKPDQKGTGVTTTASLEGATAFAAIKADPKWRTEE